MELRNLMIFSIEKDNVTDKLRYHAKDLDSKYLDDFDIKERGGKYPSDFLYGILLDNGYKPFSKEESHLYDDDLINSYCPLIFTAIYDIGATNKGGDVKDEIYSHSLIVIPNMEVRGFAEISRELKRRNDGNGF